MPLSPAEMVAACSGAGMVILAIAWRGRVRRRSRGLLRSALAHPDPAHKRAAVRMVGEMGLARHADMLLELVRLEPDPDVLDALAEAVARNQWEPADQPSLFELRVWAHRHLEAQLAASPSTQPVQVAAEPPGVAVIDVDAASRVRYPAPPLPRQRARDVAYPRRASIPCAVRLGSLGAREDMTMLRWAIVAATLVVWRAFGPQGQERRTPWA